LPVSYERLPGLLKPGYYWPNNQWGFCLLLRSFLDFQTVKNKPFCLEPTTFKGKIVKYFQVKTAEKKMVFPRSKYLLFEREKTVFFL
jgi:hypothetical protein